MALPSTSASRVVLLGTADYASDSYEQLPAVANNLDALAALLRDGSVWGLAQEFITTVRNPESPSDLIDPIVAASGNAEDTLIVYYGGHGVLDRTGELYLSLKTSRRTMEHTAVPYEWVRRAVMDSRAARRIIILDCCYSGQAVGGMGEAEAVADRAAVSGCVVLTATGAYREALAPPGEPHTAFTGELVNLLTSGVAQGPELLNLDFIFDRLRQALRAKSRPEPQMRALNTMGELTLVRNRAFVAQPQQPASKPATRVGNRYELGALLARGSTAEVYMARDLRLGRTVSVKTLRLELARDATSQAVFRRDAQIAPALNHPAIVAVYDSGEDYIGGVSLPYIVMEYVDGSTLRELLYEGRRLLPERAMEITSGVLHALDYSHRNGVVHGGIKPANVMLNRGGVIKTMDFGIAHAWDGDDSAGTRSMSAMGDLALYSSPEQIVGQRPDARSDLYSTGCLLYELFTGRPPFIGGSPLAIAFLHVNEASQPPSYFDPEVPAVGDAIVLKALAKSPDDRYQSADEMRADIERALDGRPTSVTSRQPSKVRYSEQPPRLRYSGSIGQNPRSYGSAAPDSQVSERQPSRGLFFRPRGRRRTPEQ